MEEELEEGDSIIFDIGYDWKYGEPSRYEDEKLYYLCTTLNGELLDESPENDALQLVGYTYIDMLNKIRNNGIEIYIFHKGELKTL